MSSWSFGTSASFARLPNSEVVFKFNVNSVSGDGRVIVTVGCGECGCGGVRSTFISHQLTAYVTLLNQRTVPENTDRDIVNETGNRANDSNG